MSESSAITWPADVARLNLLGGMSGSWKLYTPSILLANMICTRHASAYIYIISQTLTEEQIKVITTVADLKGNAGLNSSASDYEASVGTLRTMAFACLALSSGARSFVEIGSGYGAFAFILDQIARALGITISRLTLCDIAAAQTVQAAYLGVPTNIATVDYISLANNGSDYLGSAHMMYSAYALSELPSAARNLIIANILPQCSMLFWVWSSPDQTGIPITADTIPEYPPTGRNTLYVSRGFSLPSIP